MHCIGRWLPSASSNFPTEPADIAAYYHQLVRLNAGSPDRRTARPIHPTIGSIANAWLSERAMQLHAGHITRQTYDHDRRAMAWLLSRIAADTAIVSLRPPMFSAMHQESSRWRYHQCRHMRASVRSMLRWAHEVQGFPRVPLAKRLATPPKSKVREERHRLSRECWTREQCQALIAASRRHPMNHAIVLLMLNAACNSADIGQLGPQHIHQPTGVLRMPRSKTKFCKIAILWPETLEALRECGLSDTLTRPTILATQAGNSLITRSTATKYGVDYVARRFAQVRKRANEEFLPAGCEPITGGFPHARRTFKTVTNRSRDEHAQRLVMGHTIPGVHAEYSDGFPVARLRAITQLMHDWLHGRIDETPDDMVKLW